MKRCLQDYTLHDRSMIRRLNRAYWSQRGLAAWRSGEIPTEATSSYAMARQHAQLLVALVASLEARGALLHDSSVFVMEVGAGTGESAGRLLRALERDCGEAGERLRGRLRYILTDLSADMVTAACEQPPLDRLREEGAIIPAVFDLATDDAPRDLDGEAITAPLTAVIASYVCCAIGGPLLQKVRGGEWRALFTRVDATIYDPELLAEHEGDALRVALLEQIERGDSPRAAISFDQEWRGVALEAALDDPADATLVRAMLEDLPSATMTYPRPFLGFMRRIRARLIEGGGVLINDYGSPDRAALGGLREQPPQVYGNTVNYSVNFALFDALATHEGWGVARTLDALRAVHHAFVCRGEVAQTVATRFDEIYAQEQASERFIEALTAAERASKGRDHLAAARFYARCVALAPEDLSLRCRFGLACLNAGAYVRALEVLREGHAADADMREDFAYLAGLSCERMGRDREALDWFERALEREDHPATHAQLAAAHLALGDVERARAEATRALADQADHPVARRVLDALVSGCRDEV